MRVAPPIAVRRFTFRNAMGLVASGHGNRSATGWGHCQKAVLRYLCSALSKDRGSVMAGRGAQPVHIAAIAEAKWRRCALARVLAARADAKPIEGSLKPATARSLQSVASADEARVIKREGRVPDPGPGRIRLVGQWHFQAQPGQRRAGGG